MSQQIIPASTSFVSTLKKHDINLYRESLSTLQVNIGKRCNQACHHCHVESSPIRTENMATRTVDRILELLKISPSIKTVDITGGAPELNPNFRYFVSKLKKLNLQIIDRCNLTVLFETGQEETPAFLKEHKVEIIASLPCYSMKNVDQQRGRGVFNKSVKALQILNELGYGKKDSGLVLNLVYNPLGAFLPPEQSKLEQDYRDKLFSEINVEFNNLYTITNMPIKRFLVDLQKQNKLEDYMELLVQSFNPNAASNVMCKDLVSVSWDGQIYDCDFNQMLEIPISDKTTSLWQIDSFSDLIKKKVAIQNHCYACTAGSGSSCGGVTV